ncbi:OmpA/MotB family protein [Helicobacter sp. 23-1045]
MARKKVAPPPKPGGLPLWLGTFGDLMSLLLTFFILLLSMATFDKEKVQQAIGSVQGALSILEHGVETEITPPNPIQALPLQTESNKIEVLNVFASLMNEYSEMSEISDGPGIDLEESDDGFILRIPDDLLFASGGVEIVNPSGRVFLERVALEIERFRDILALRIIGNTDNAPFRAGSAMDNWDLSNKRALSVANALLSLKIPSNIMQIGGDADFNPVADNATPQGRAKNRRVDLHFSVVGDVSDKEQKANEIIKNLDSANIGAQSAESNANQNSESKITESTKN